MPKTYPVSHSVRQTWTSICNTRRLPSVSPLAPQLTQLQSFYDLVVNRLNSDQHSFGAGVRYDFAPNYALKFQIDHVSARESTLLMDDSGMPARNTNLTLYSVVLDFVF